MKHLTMITCALVLSFATACKTSDVPIPPSPQQLSAGARTFDGNECIGNSGACLPDIVVTPKLYPQHGQWLSDFDQAVGTGSTATYFASGRWTNLMPALELRPREFEVLKSGIPLIRVDKPNGKRFYVATRVSREELLRRIETNHPGFALAGVEVCIPITVK